MSALIIQNELRTRFYEQWGVTTPIAWPNILFNPMVGTPWCRFTVQLTSTEDMEIGTEPKTYRTLGILYVQIFTPKNEGDAEALDLANQVVSIFRRWRGSTVKCRPPSIDIIGHGQQGDDWFQVNVIVTFEQDIII